ncbi:hypothetical protein KZ813_19225 [Sphingomonas sp. RHCKR7]|uniref:hypothetical protein n=1 Tax=Sphingomonas folli TaxID=2862497 RepID=UPI001CA48F4F|nr:hypothetical protein [Sphingomonas folli]MBW6528977.1 hypothetical protein [Sphingomonas folli]
MWQLIIVAEHTSDKTTRHALHTLPSAQPNKTVAESVRRIHDLAGHAYDLQFTLLRALNDSASALGPRDLKRPDAIAAAKSVFERLTAIAMSLNSLDNALDGASFGEFLVIVRCSRQ